jgi:hypothetical protein
MNVRELLRWQWEGYATYHQSHANLLLHIVVVPLFWLGNVGLIVALLQGSLLLAVVSAIAMLVSVALQGKGHAQESVPSIPFSSPVNAVWRIFLEQWVSFPRFVISGGWWRAVREAG